MDTLAPQALYTARRTGAAWRYYDCLVQGKPLGQCILSDIIDVEVLIGRKPRRISR